MGREAVTEGRGGGRGEGRPLGSHGAWRGCQLLLFSGQAPRDPEPRCRTSLVNYGPSEASAGADADTSLQSGRLSPPASRHRPICHRAKLRLRGGQRPKQGRGGSEIQIQVGSAHPTPTPPAPAPWTAPSGLCHSCRVRGEASWVRSSSWPLSLLSRSCPAPLSILPCCLPAPQPHGSTGAVESDLEMREVMGAVMGGGGLE